MEWTSEQLHALCVNNGLSFYNATQHYGLCDPHWGSPYQPLFEVKYTTPEVTNEAGKPELQKISGSVETLKERYNLCVKLYGTYLYEDVESNTLEAWDAALKKLFASTAFARCKEFKGEERAKEQFLEKLQKTLQSEFKTVKRKGSKLLVEGCTVNTEGLFGLRVGRTDLRFRPLSSDFDQTVVEVVSLVRKKVLEEEPKPTDFRRIEFSGYDLDTGDERECAELTLRWDTSLGTLSYCEKYTANETYSTTWALDGDELLENRNLWYTLSSLVRENLSERDLSPPTHASRRRAEESWRDEFDGVNLQLLLAELKEELKEKA